MDIRPYLAPIQKWWWLIIAAVALAVGTSYLAVRNQPPVYNSGTTLIIGRTIFDPNPSSNDIYLNQQLGSLYSDIAYQDPVQTATMKALGMTWLPQYTVRPLANSQFIQIIVTDTDPERAYKVATELADQLVNLSPANSQSADQVQQQFIQDQLTQTQTDITDTQKQIADQQAALGKLQSARDIAQAQANLQALQAKMTLLQTNYANLVQSTQGGATNILRVIEPATVPTKPVGPSKYLIILIAGVIGLGLALAAVYLLEFLDDTIKSPDDVSKLVDLPVIGFLADLGKKFTEKPYVADNPRSMLAEAYRSLRASMEFNRQERPYQVILVSSPEAGDGKTSVAVNLAVTMLHGGKNVLLVDADFRKPNVHNVLALPNKTGLCDVLNKELDLHKVVQKWDGLGLRVVTAGQSSEYLDELLQPERLQAVIAQLREAADVVIIDSSPFLVSDAMAMLPFVDGTLLVIRPGHTHRKMIKIVAERVRQTGGSLIGVVLNRIPLGQSGYYGGYHNYSPYYFSHYGYQDGNHKGKNGTKVGKGKDKKEILKEFAVFKVINRKDS